MQKNSNLIIVCQPALSKKAGTKYYIIESGDSDLDPDNLNQITLLGDAGIVGHIVGIENTLNAAKKVYRNLLRRNLLQIAKADTCKPKEGNTLTNQSPLRTTK